MGRRGRCCLQWLASVVFVYLCVAVYYNLDPPDLCMTVETQLPTSWVKSAGHEARLAHRRHHLARMCRETGLAERSPRPTIRTQEFLINREFGLVWCPVFKAASSTWLWNFNLLAGYTKDQLLQNIHRPLAMARARYPKPSQRDLDSMLGSSPAPLAFMIARHPLHRLVSAYRNKIIVNKKDYRSIIRAMMTRHPELGPSGPWTWFEVVPGRVSTPTFRQFVQYILEQHDEHQPLNEHWVPASQFCTPCLVNYTVLAKVETLDEDASYIVFTAGIEGLVSPRLVNKSPQGATGDVVRHYLCQLSHREMQRLIHLYRYDILLFDYDVSEYLTCTRHNL